MKDSPKLVKIIIEAAGHKFELTPEEAKSLRDILVATFPDNKTNYIPIPQPYPVYPYNPWYQKPYRWNQWDVVYTATQGSQTSGQLSLCSNGGTIK